MSSNEEPRAREDALRQIDEQLDALGGDVARGRSLVVRWLEGADRDAVLADLEASTTLRALSADVAVAPVAVAVAATSAVEASDDVAAAPVESPQERAAPQGGGLASAAVETAADLATSSVSDAPTPPVTAEPPPPPVAAEPPPPVAAEPPPPVAAEPPPPVAAEPPPPVGVTTAEPADERPERPSRAPRRKSALPPPVRRSEPPLSSRPPDSRIAIPATERAVRVSDRPLRTSEPPRLATEAPPTRASEPPRHSDRPARLSSVPPLDDGGLSLDLGEIGPAEGTRVSQSDLPAETTHASVIAAALDQATDPGSVLPPRARASDVPPPMGGDPFASRTSTPGSVAPPPLADLFGDADDVLFGPDASRPLSVAAPPLTPPPSEPVRGSLEVDLDDLDSELDSFIEDDGDVTASPLQPTRHAGFTALDTVMADPFDAEEQEPTTIGSVASLGLGGNDEVEPTLVASVDQFEELGLGLSGAPQPSAAPQAPSSAPPLGGLRATSAPPPADAPRQKGFLKKLFGGK